MDVLGYLYGFTEFSGLIDHLLYLFFDLARPHNRAALNDCDNQPGRNALLLYSQHVQHRCLR